MPHHNQLNGCIFNKDIDCKFCLTAKGFFFARRIKKNSFPHGWEDFVLPLPYLQFNLLRIVSTAHKRSYRPRREVN